MNLPDYFSFYNMDPALFLDEKTLRQAYLSKSRQSHPDFFAQTSLQEQENALDIATYNNRAYQTLSNFDKRLQYILEINGWISENERYELPPAFLMEMMDINEAINDAKSKEDLLPIEQQISILESDLNGQISQEYPSWGSLNPENEGAKKKLKEFYYKMRYLLRIQKILRTFAPS